MVKIIAKMDPRDGAKLVGKWLYVQASYANGDRQCELDLTQKEYHGPFQSWTADIEKQIVGEPPEGMVRTVIDLPAPPVPYERIVWRELKRRDYYLETASSSPVKGWTVCDYPPVSGQLRLCLDLPAPKVTFPASVPGFKKGTWFARDNDGKWKSAEEQMIPRYESSTHWPRSCWTCPTGYVVQKRHTGYDALQALNEVPWDQSQFVTTEDG